MVWRSCGVIRIVYHINICEVNSSLNDILINFSFAPGTSRTPHFYTPLFLCSKEKHDQSVIICGEMYIVICKRHLLR